MTWPIVFSSLFGCSFLILEEAVNPESAKDSVRYHFIRRTSLASCNWPASSVKLLVPRKDVYAHATAGTPVEERKAD
jgi:hypothetical protein